MRQRPSTACQPSDSRQVAAISTLSIPERFVEQRYTSRPEGVKLEEEVLVIEKGPVILSRYPYEDDLRVAQI